MMDLKNLRARLRDITGTDAPLELVDRIAGGDINRAFRARYGARQLFVKLNRLDLAEMFEAEHTALKVLRESGTVRVPEPLGHGTDGDVAWLALEYIEFGRAGNPADLGRDLAAMHRVTGPGFGWPANNFIGATVQINDWRENWQEFWWDCRIAPQVALATEHGLSAGLARMTAELRRRSDVILAHHRPRASLLHGDLWGGNHGYDVSGKPVVFDPASYYGDRETDLAMTELFGGFGPAFYEAYYEACPAEPGYEERKPLYQLYHLLNHLNLFGGSWLDRVVSAMGRLLRAS